MSISRIFRRPDYQSEATQFIAQIKKDRPDLIQQQRTGMALLWDREQDREALSEFAAARVPQQPYVYQTHG